MTQNIQLSTKCTHAQYINTCTDQNLKDYLKDMTKFKMSDEQSQEMSINEYENICPNNMENGEPDIIQKENTNLIQMNYNTNEFNNSEEENLNISFHQNEGPEANFNKLFLDKENDYPEKNNKSTTEEQKQKQNISSNNQDSMHFNSEKILEYNSTLFNAKTDKKNFFDVIYPEKKYSFYFNRIIDIKRTRFKNRRKRFENQDNIRKKIKRGFLNNYLYNRINNFLKEGKIRHKNFERFSQKFVSDVTIQANKKILSMTLRQIIKKKDLYINQKDLKNYMHNLKVLSSLKEEKNIKLEKFLDCIYRDLFEDYINSDEFKINEINRLKKKGMSDWYIKNYIYLSTHFIKFFEDKN